MYITGTKRTKRKGLNIENVSLASSYSTSSSDRLSTSAITQVVERLKNMWHRDSTKKTYYNVWKSFNKFIIKLDEKPVSWEQCMVLFVAYLVHCKKQYSTIKSYLSAIRAVLKTEGVKLQEDQFLITSLTKACKMTNDKVRIRKPINKKLLAKLVKGVKDHFEGASSNQQPYLSTLYQTLLTVTYYGLFRVGEVTSGTHPVLAKDVFIGFNKRKLLFVLHSSKTHDCGNEPQLIKISSTSNVKTKNNLAPCPYALMRKYSRMRGPYDKEGSEPFFVFRDGSPVTPAHFRALLKLILTKLGYNEKFFNIHSLRIGRSNDLLKLGLSVETIKKLGRWKSNAVFRYLK